jgi:hypothetical protein
MVAPLLSSNSFQGNQFKGVEIGDGTGEGGIEADAYWPATPEVYRYRCYDDVAVFADNDQTERAGSAAVAQDRAGSASSVVRSTSLRLRACASRSASRMPAFRPIAKGGYSARKGEQCRCSVSPGAWSGGGRPLGATRPRAGGDGAPSEFAVEVPCCREAWNKPGIREKIGK